MKLSVYVCVTCLCVVLFGMVVWLAYKFILWLSSLCNSVCITADFHLQKLFCKVDDEEKKKCEEAERLKSEGERRGKAWHCF